MENKDSLAISQPAKGKDRSQNFLKGQNFADLKIKKENFQLQLRKEHRQSLMSKKRKVPKMSTPKMVMQKIQCEYINFNVPVEMVELAPEMLKSGQTIIKLIDIIKGHITRSEEEKNKDNLRTCIMSFRKLINFEQNYELFEVLFKCQVTKLLIRFINPSGWAEDPVIQKEVLHAIFNISSGTQLHAQEINIHGGIKKVVEQLSTTNKDEIQKFCLYILGNVAINSEIHQEHVIQKGALDLVLSMIIKTEQQSSINIQCLRDQIWLLSQLMRYKDNLSNSQITEAINIFIRNLTFNDQSIQYDCAKGINYVMNFSQYYLNQVAGHQDQVHQTFLNWLDSQDIKLALLGLKILANYLTGTEQNTNLILGHDLFSKIQTILQSKGSNREIQYFVLFMMSNIAAGTQEQLQVLLEKQDLIGWVFIKVQSSEIRLKKEAMYIIRNILCGNLTNNQYFLQMDIIGVINKILVSKPDDSELLLIILQSLQKLCEVGSQTNEQGLNNQFTKFYEQECWDYVNELAYHKHKDVSDLAIQILNYYNGSQYEGEALDLQLDQNDLVFD